MKTFNRFLLAPLLAAALLGGCKDDFPPGPDPDPNPISQTLPGTEWRLVSYETVTGEVVVVDSANATSAITLNFAPTGISCGGVGPCNVYGGDCKINNGGAGNLEIDNIFSTNAACDRLDLELLYIAALDAATRYVIDANALHILVGGGANNMPTNTPGGVTVLNFAPVKTQNPPATKGEIQFRKVGAASDVFALHSIYSDGSNESVVTSWMNFISDAPRSGVSAYLAQDPITMGFSVMVSEPGSGTPRTVVPHTGALDFAINSVAISPDGKRVAVIAYDALTAGPQSFYNLYIFDLNGTPIDTMLNAEPFTTPSFSADGNQIAYYGRSSGTSSPVVNTVMVGTVSSNVGERELANNAMPHIYPCEGRLQWLPNGAGVAYVGIDAAASQTDIWLAPTAGGAPTNLTNDPNLDSWPIVHPSGNQIAYVHENGGGIYQIYRVTLNGMNVASGPEEYGPTRLATVVMHDLFPQWSPDGTQLLYTAFTNVAPNGQPSYSGTLERMETSDHVPHRVADGAERGFWEL